MPDRQPVLETERGRERERERKREEEKGRLSNKRGNKDIFDDINLTNKQQQKKYKNIFDLFQTPWHTREGGRWLCQPSAQACTTGC